MSSEWNELDWFGGIVRRVSRRGRMYHALKVDRGRIGNMQIDSAILTALLTLLRSA